MAHLNLLTVAFNIFYFLNANTDALF